jgi:hypothetical protein
MDLCVCTRVCVEGQWRCPDQKLSVIHSSISAIPIHNNHGQSVCIDALTNRPANHILTDTLAMHSHHSHSLWTFLLISNIAFFILFMGMCGAWLDLIVRCRVATRDTWLKLTDWHTLPTGVWVTLQFQSLQKSSPSLVLVCQTSTIHVCCIS